jgi:hypothetical protein
MDHSCGCARDNAVADAPLSVSPRASRISLMQIKRQVH